MAIPSEPLGRPGSHLAYHTSPALEISVGRPQDAENPAKCVTFLRNEERSHPQCDSFSTEKPCEVPNFLILGVEGQRHGGFLFKAAQQFHHLKRSDPSNYISYFFFSPSSLVK